jgi:uncharacterized LabA/DUF88 family protein
MAKKQDKSPTVYAFIDSSNIWQAQKSKGQFFDWQKLQRYLKGRYNASEIEIFYYAAYPANNTRDYDLDPKHRFYTFLKKGLGFNVRKKKLKRIRVTTEEGEAWKEKGDMDVEITVDAMHHVEKYDIVLLFSGDSDFMALVSYLRNKDKSVYVYSSENNISHELRTGSDGYTDVLKIDAEIWGKKLRHRKQKRG